MITARVPNAGLVESSATEVDEDSRGAEPWSDPIQRLVVALRPERTAEEEAIEAVGTGHVAGALADAVERAMKREFLRGAEVGRREIEEEHGIVREPW